jgi:Ca2+-binding RTX toxin-like protein
MNGMTRSAVDVLSPQSPGAGWTLESVGAGFVGNSSTDTVHSMVVSYTLPAGIQNLVLESGALNGTGNALDNSITGNSLDNILTAGTGNDVLTGGGGNDTFRFGDVIGIDQIADFNAPGQGADKIDLSGRSTHYTFAQIQSMSTDNGHDTTIHFGSSSSITIVGKLVTDLQPSHFIL